MPTWVVYPDSSPKMPLIRSNSLAIIEFASFWAENGLCLLPKIYLPKAHFHKQVFPYKGISTIQRLKPSPHITGNDTIFQTGDPPYHHTRTRKWDFLALIHGPSSWLWYTIFHLVTFLWLNGSLNSSSEWKFWEANSIQLQCIPWASSH